jgi:hypothetical protein
VPDDNKIKLHNVADDNKIKLNVPGIFSELKEKVVVRLSYLEPELTFSLVADGIEIQGSKAFDPDRLTELRETVFHQLYREKIYQDTLPIRQWLNSDE